MRKNHQLHFYIDKDLKQVLEREAEERGVSLSELCRQKLKESSQLTRLELLIEALLKKKADFGLPKAPKSAISR